LLRRTLNLGILAHVDAGKTTLTERLLYRAGVIEAIGSVDAGTTQTDSLPLEQQRGITIKSAVVSFAIDDVTVNLIDTPGHPDFIAEVERVLNVLDGAVLVISAVEGVQPQTRLLMRALRRLRVPTLLFVNKIDRRGADSRRVLAEISEKLTPAIVGMTSARGEGSRAASVVAHTEYLVEALAEHNDALLRAYVEDAAASPRQLQAELAAQTKQALVHPVYFGSAITGAGVNLLTEAIAELLPVAAGDADEPLSARVFKVERGPAGEKIAYARVFSGTIRVRDRLHFRDGKEAKVTALAGPATGTDAVAAGEIARLWGLAEVEIGDTIGELGSTTPAESFPPPTLEAFVAPRDPSEQASLYVALTQLTEQDPLINVRRGEHGAQLSVSLYGEVQKEVLESTLADEYGLEVEFREATPIYIERPVGRGYAIEVLNTEGNPFHATMGLRVDPAPEGAGIELRLQVDHEVVPIYAYKTRDRFADAMEQYVRDALREGLYGWQVTDCVVTMTDSDYSSADGPPAKRGPLPTPADFRKLTPVVLMQALEHAGTVVCEPTVRVAVEVPAPTIGAVMAALGRLGAAVETPSVRAELATIEGTLSAVRADSLLRQLPPLTGGEGVLESTFAGYLPVSGEFPTRRSLWEDRRP